MSGKSKRKQVLILGASGMAGHMVYQYLQSLDKYDIGAITREKTKGIQSVCVDIEEDLSVLANIIETASPDIIINCIGLLVKDCEACPAEAIYINSFFPHMLENITSDMNVKIIHLSTDCVFKGDQGLDYKYKEDDLPTETNWYGRSKAFGELVNNKDLTLRLSIVGPELKDGVGLLHWFLKQTEPVNGFTNHYWNGITTLELAKQLDRIINTDLTGLYHLAPNFSISKYALLKAFNTTFEKKLLVNPSETVNVAKVLVNTRKSEYDPAIPSYKDQLDELKSWMQK